MKSCFALGLAIVCLFSSGILAQTFIPISGNQFWNVNSNWSTDPAPFPNGSGVSATLSAPTGDLNIDLGVPITIGSLTVNKAVTGDFDTTISGTATNTLTFDGGFTILNGFSSVGTGLTTVAAPVVFNSTLTVTQGDNDILDFTQPLSGSGGLAVNRNAGTYSTVVALSAANTYQGATTTFTGSTADDSLVIRLNPTTALPSTTNVTLTQSAILELTGGNFTRPIGAGPGEIQFSGNGRNGWGAFGANREVNLGGALGTVTWGSGVGQANFGQLVLGNSTSNATVDFRNSLDLGTSNRNIRSYDGSAGIDGKISGIISGTGFGITKINDGTLSLAAANTYTGNTIVQGGTLRLDHQDALGSGNLQIGSGGVLGIGADTTPGDPLSDFARNLGAAAGQIQLTNIGSGGNQTNAGFSAHGGNRSVVLNAGAMLTWGSGSFLSGGTGTVNRQFILSGDNADSTLDFKNPIDLAGANRTVVARNGSASIDAKLSGVISGTGAASGLIKDNPGTLELSNSNSYGGITRITAGALLLTHANAIPGGTTGGNTGNIEINSSNPNNIGVIGLGASDLTSAPGTGPNQFQIVGSGGFAAYGANRVVNLGSSQLLTWGGPNFVASGGRLAIGAGGADATVDFQNPIDLNAGAREVTTRNGTADIDGILSGVISGAGGSFSKVGPGTLILSGANTYDGGTTISEGQLLVNNTGGSGTGSGAIAVNAGTLGGTGSISGTVTVASGAHIAPGESIESLDAGSLVLDSGSILDFELGTPGSPGITSDLINVTATNGLTVNGGTVNLTNAGGLASGTYTLVDYSGNLSGGVGLMTLGTQPAGFSYSLVNNPSNSSVDLHVNALGLPGDFNSDGKVDAGDYVTWRKNDGTNNALANDNGLGTPVGLAHFNLWRANFGNPPGSGSGGGLGRASAVPEPAAVSLLWVIGPLVAMRRRGFARR